MIYLYLFRRYNFFQFFSCWRLLLFILYWFATITCNLIDIRSLTETRIRTNIFSIFYIILLIFSNRLSFVADLLDLSLYTFYALYNSINFIAIVQILIYMLIFVLYNTLQLRDSLHFYSFLIYWIFSIIYWLISVQIDIAIYCFFLFI